ncbi:MAG: hypothetical protein ACTSRP_02170 [Candidatus Helarchaeota archaeon]
MKKTNFEKEVERIVEDFEKLKELHRKFLKWKELEKEFQNEEYISPKEVKLFSEICQQLKNRGLDNFVVFLGGFLEKRYRCEHPISYQKFYWKDGLKEEGVLVCLACGRILQKFGDVYPERNFRKFKKFPKKIQLRLTKPEDIEL